MSLTARLELSGPPASEPEDFLSSSLGVIFPDDVTNQHGDADHGLIYTSPHLPRPLHIGLAAPDGESDRRLFSHYLWNASLLLAELIEAGTLHLSVEPETSLPSVPSSSSAAMVSVSASALVSASSTPVIAPISHFDVSGLSTIELGAGTALPSLLAALLGARRVVMTDYPAPAVLAALRSNVAGNVRASHSPPGRAPPASPEDVVVEGHAWGELETPLAAAGRHAFDRVIAADCLWMPWQHDNLRRSVAWFLADDTRARAWVVAGFHTGRAKMREFFDSEALAAVGLEVEHIWERDCDGKDRAWVWDRGIEDVSERKRWLVVAVLRRVQQRGEVVRGTESVETGVLR